MEELNKYKIFEKSGLADTTYEFLRDKFRQSLSEITSN